MTANLTDTVRVEQCDREAAAPYLTDAEWHPLEIASGDADQHWLIQLLARHRLSAALSPANAQDEALRVATESLRDIAEAEAIPNDAAAFVWCRAIARTALSLITKDATDVG